MQRRRPAVLHAEIYVQSELERLRVKEFYPKHLLVLPLLFPPEL